MVLIKKYVLDFCNYFLKIELICDKENFRCKTISSQNVSYEAQAWIFFTL